MYKFAQSRNSFIVLGVIIIPLALLCILYSCILEAILLGIIFVLCIWMASWCSIIHRERMIYRHVISQRRVTAMVPPSKLEIHPKVLETKENNGERIIIIDE